MSDVEEGPPIEPAAVAALTRMGEAIAAMKTFELKSATSVEIVLDDDQKLLVEGTADYRARRPDRLRVEMTTDVVHRELVYDGRTVTYASPDRNVYGSFDAPPTIKAMLERAAATYDLSLPLADLFDWGTPDAPFEKILRAFKVGEATIGGKSADHYAFRAEDQDWELWLAAEGDPLPLKYSLVDRLDPAGPRFSATLEWTPREAIPDDEFRFVPPGGMTKIGFLKSEDGK
ncbi:DUF2092 domain-containing protein [Aureimonas leprariae]|uniref:DUF2092 domain-containing protein n=2 Tax=Plantimonas leprariae TaxID=2615207 RepID=A0A7V7TVV5_9HYPH|nr:DUF2092 domain-containing protein [Aureimonas leprariae]